ncbi:MAG: hypothetical protein QW085_01535 [Pyrobaculum sp.]
MDAAELFRNFYFSLGIPLRAIIEFKIRRRGAALDDIFERPWLLFHYVEQDLGRHNAELLITLFVEYVKKYGVSPNIAAAALKSPEGWKKFVEYLENL